VARAGEAVIASLAFRVPGPYALTSSRLEGRDAITSVASELPHRILLRGANLQQADLSGSNLAHIDLRGTYLAGTHLEDADLEGANLEGADLSGAYLGGANLKGASVGDEQLAMCKSLEGATMPDGSKHD
jgi:uncharacterized protein YjbI with pentapeptide repeats